MRQASPTRIATRWLQARLSQRIKDAIAESLANLPEQVRWDMEQFSHLVLVGKTPTLEKHTRVMYKAFAPLRKVLGSVTMYRGEPLSPPEVPRKWLSWSTRRDIAAKFANRKGFHLIEAKTSAKDVVAAITSPYNESYIEYIVLNRPKYHKPSPAQIPLYYTVLMSESNLPFPEHLNPWEDTPDTLEARFPRWGNWLRETKQTIERAGGAVVKVRKPTGDNNPSVGYIIPPDKTPPFESDVPGVLVPRMLGKIAVAPEKWGAAYDPESWYYDYTPGTSLQTVIDRWQKARPGLTQRGRPFTPQKIYDRTMPIKLTVRELWPLREYTWSREKARGGYARVNGKRIYLEGALKWDALKEDLRINGWDPQEPLYLEIGSKGGVKVGEGNHRLALAHELGMSTVPVWILFKKGKVRKSRPGVEAPIEVSPRAVEKAVEKAEEKPRTPEEQEVLDNLMELILGKHAGQHSR